jgi:hypothetical protein
LSKYRRQKQYYQNKMYRPVCKKFFSLLRWSNAVVKNTSIEEEIENFWNDVGKG